MCSGVSEFVHWDALWSCWLAWARSGWITPTLGRQCEWWLIAHCFTCTWVPEKGNESKGLGWLKGKFKGSIWVVTSLHQFSLLLYSWVFLGPKVVIVLLSLPWTKWAHDAAGLLASNTLFALTGFMWSGSIGHKVSSQTHCRRHSTLPLNMSVLSVKLLHCSGKHADTLFCGGRGIAYQYLRAGGSDKRLLTSAKPSFHLSAVTS